MVEKPNVLDEGVVVKRTGLVHNRERRHHFQSKLELVSKVCVESCVEKEGKQEQSRSVGEVVRLSECPRTLLAQPPSRAATSSSTKTTRRRSSKQSRRSVRGPRRDPHAIRVFARSTKLRA